MDWQPGDTRGPRRSLDFNLFTCSFNVYFLHEWGGAGRALYPTGKPKAFLFWQIGSAAIPVQLGKTMKSHSLLISLYLSREFLRLCMREKEAAKKWGKVILSSCFLGVPIHLALSVSFRLQALRCHGWLYACL